MVTKLKWIQRFSVIQVVLKIYKLCPKIPLLFSFISTAAYLTTAAVLAVLLASVSLLTSVRTYFRHKHPPKCILKDDEQTATSVCLCLY